MQEIKRFVASSHDSLVEKTKTLTEELYAKIYRDQAIIKESLSSQIKRQKDYSEPLDIIEKKIEQKQVTTCKFKETPVVTIKSETSTERIRNDGLDITQRVASHTPSIGHQNLMIQRVRDSTYNIRTCGKKEIFHTHFNGRNGEKWTGNMHNNP